jgi:hypothetical protein
MVRKILPLVIMCALLLAVGCSEEDPVDPSAEYERELAEKERELAESEETIQILEQGLWDNLHAPQSQPVAKGVLKIAAGSHSESAFTVTAAMSNARLTGSFREVGGTALYVYVFDNLNFVNWSAGGDSTVLYNSGKVVVGEIDVGIRSPGMYHLVFSNTHSWVTEKNVDAAVDLWFEM